MSWSAIGLTVAVVLGMSSGQILFKLAAGRGGAVEIMLSPVFWSAVALYGVVTILWVMLLREIDLSRAYPFIAATYILVPAASVAILGEKVGLSYLLGVALIVAGIVLAGRA
ncbi:MAG: 4-amino-4-deoxy-L-arabinose-phospho-UDP flippase [Alphaproteobacteria bacterium]|nr:4-amino-4-deoxy-L-arabinose-phospho-UDP flippase [Alphaproteobacteria bacterium]